MRRRTVSWRTVGVAAGAPGVAAKDEVTVPRERPNPPNAMVPPASSPARASLLNCGSEQALWPLTAIGTVTALLSSPPALTCTDAKQSGAISAGSVKLICQSPGNPEDAPAYCGVIGLPPTVTMKFPAAG